MTEDDVAEKIANMVDNASEALFNAIKYCYMITEDDFYNINVKDLFKVGLGNVTNKDVFKYLGLRLEDDKIGEMSSDRFREVLEMIRYSFAVRLPFIRKYAPESGIREPLVRHIYEILEESGFSNPDGIIEYSYKSMSWLVKTKKSEPPFDTEWFRSWIYTYGHDLAVINNRNMFILGCADALFPLYYSSLQEKLIEEFNRFV